ncbi:MAG: SMC-Scp complex subunit ScpB [Planctomycetes bacterium]|nr:SMC-Scp complex subunit ScpB [Planctomycetota bacterium]
MIQAGVEERSVALPSLAEGQMESAVGVSPPEIQSDAPLDSQRFYRNRLPSSAALPAEVGVETPAVMAKEEVPAALPAEAPELSLPELQSAIEAVLFSTGEPVTIRQLAELFEISVHDVREAVENLRLDLVDHQRAFRLQEVAGGLKLLTLPHFHPWVAKLQQSRKQEHLSPAALETLSVIAYKQPISKAALEGIRGVQCTPILKTLMDRGLIKIVGREESLGKPLLYGTTQLFLETFGLPSVTHLPQPELDLANGNGQQNGNGQPAASAQAGS